MIGHFAAEQAVVWHRKPTSLEQLLLYGFRNKPTCKIYLSTYTKQHKVTPAALPPSQEAQRRLQAARREASSGKVAAELSARLAELEAETGAALAKAERENGGVYLQVQGALPKYEPCA